MTNEGGPGSAGDHDRDPSTPVGDPAAKPSEPSAASGSIARQEPGVTQPRPPTVAEARARDKARRRAAEAEQAKKEAAEGKRRGRKRVLMGGAAVAGVAALVAGSYGVYRAVSGPRPQSVTARCILDGKGQQRVVEDRYCRDGRSGPNGIFLLGGQQYRYYYGGNSAVGQVPAGGSTVMPKGAEVKTKSGTVIQRGGLGSKSGSGKSGGS